MFGHPYSRTLQGLLQKPNVGGLAQWDAGQQRTSSLVTVELQSSLWVAETDCHGLSLNANLN